MGEGLLYNSGTMGVRISLWAHFVFIFIYPTELVPPVRNSEMEKVMHLGVRTDWKCIKFA